MVTTKEHKFISVVARVRNDRERVKPFLDTVMGACAALFEKCELIFVDDASTDGTVDEIRAYYEASPADYMVSIVKLGISQGLESAMNAGRDLAIGDFVFEFDDLIVDYDTDMIRQAYESCIAGHDIVEVSSDAPMRWTSRLFYRIYNSASRTRIPVEQTTFRLLTRRAVNRVKSLGVHIPYRKAVYLNCGLSVQRLRYHASGKGVTVHSVGEGRTELATDSFIYFTNVMEKVALIITSVFFFIALAVAVYVIVSIFTDDQMASGWVSMMGFLSLAFMGVFGLLAIMLKYLSVIVNLVFRRQRYLIEDIEKIKGN